MCGSFLVLALGLMPVLGDANQQALADVAAGRLTEAKASWWGFDPQDATRCLQAAIDSGVRKLVVDNVGQPWVVTPMKLASDQEVVFEPGVEVRAKPGAFVGEADCLFEAKGKQNIKLVGHGATLRMRRADYAAPPYRHSEHRHCLHLASCTNVQVLGLTLLESGGDGVYLGVARPRGANRDIVIKDVVCSRNHRQGISVISVDGLTVENTVLRAASGTLPMSGIDFEPHVPADRLTSVVVRGCTIENNAGDGVDVAVGRLDATSAPVDIRFEHCRVTGNRDRSVCLATGNSVAGAARGAVTFADCSFERSGHAAIEIKDKPPHGLQLRFERCSIVASATDQPDTAPVVFAIGQAAVSPAGGVVFDQCLLRDEVRRPPFALVDHAGVGATDVTGSLRWEHDGETDVVALTPTKVAEWLPPPQLRALPRLGLSGLALAPVAARVPAAKRVATFARLRGQVHLALHAQQGETVTLRLASERVGRYAGKPLAVTVKAPDGQPVALAEVAFETMGDVVFQAPATGVYRVSTSTGQNQCRVVAASHAVLLVGDEEPIHLLATVGELYFWVPAGVRVFGVRLCGQSDNEAVKGTLVDPRGRVVETRDNITAVHQFEVQLPAPSPGEAWSIRLARATGRPLEDHFVDLRGVPPLLGASPQALLR